MSVIYEDIGCSGKRTANRPALRALLTSARERLFEFIVIDDFYRLSRDAADFATLLHELANAGVVVLALDGSAEPFVRAPVAGGCLRPKDA
jgi:DNA invertase Pin-like site-specific DNA recombinase